MKFLSYRTGFAANSSSMHSPMIVDNIDDVIEERFGKGFEYAEFVIKEKKTLLEYLAAQINSTMRNNLHRNERRRYVDPGMNKIIIDGLLGVEVFPDVSRYSFGSLYVQDDMAGWILPRRKGCTRIIPDYEFIADLKNYLLRENVVIEGCNLNFQPKKASRNNRDNFKIRSARPLRKISHGGDDDWFAYKEDNVWRLFNTLDGTKIRLTMDDHTELEYATTPELIDLIISDRCDNGCNFCYRSCKADGKIASLDEIRIIIEMIVSTNTSEVAIGGGDILTYPELNELLKMLREYAQYDLIFNTTINIKSIKKREKDIDTVLNDITGTFKSVAISVSNIRDVKYFTNNFKKIFEDNNCIISFQLIPELLNSMKTISKIDRIISNADYYYADNPKTTMMPKITMLGFKYPQDRSSLDPMISDRIERMRNSEERGRLARIAYKGDFQCDTQFLKNFPELQDWLTPGTYETREGAFSCCINAMERKLYKSSYHLEHSHTLYELANDEKLTPYACERILDRYSENPILAGFRKVREAYENSARHLTADQDA